MDRLRAYALLAFSKPITISVVVSVIASLTLFAVVYHGLSKRVDRELEAGPLQHTFSYFAAPEILSLGDPAPTSAGNGVSLHSGTTHIQVANGAISAIVDLANRRGLVQTEIPAQLISDVSDEGRAKRLMLRYAEVPPVLVHAIVSAEDKRFFEHSGIDFLRIAKASYVDFRERRKEQGASTISMQLARSLCLVHDKSWKRKMTEALIALYLEHKLTKQQIFEDYCNMVYLGNQGTFSINGLAKQHVPISTKTYTS